MPRLQTGSGRTQEARKERGCTEAEKAKGKEMTEAQIQKLDKIINEATINWDIQRILQIAEFDYGLTDIEIDVLLERMTE